MHTAGRTEGIAKNNTMKVLFIVIIVLMIIIPIVWSWVNDEEEKPKVVTLPSSAFRDSSLKDFGKVGPGQVWETRIDFRFFKIYPTQDIHVRYTKKNGGWTEKVLVLASGNFVEAPQEVGRGPIKVTLVDTSLNANSSYVELFEMIK